MLCLDKGIKGNYCRTWRTSSPIESSGAWTRRMLKTLWLRLDSVLSTVWATFLLFWPNRVDTHTGGSNFCFARFQETANNRSTSVTAIRPGSNYAKSKLLFFSITLVKCSDQLLLYHFKYRYWIEFIQHKHIYKVQQYIYWLNQNTTIKMLWIYKI